MDEEYSAAYDTWSSFQNLDCEQVSASLHQILSPDQYEQLLHLYHIKTVGRRSFHPSRKPSVVVNMARLKFSNHLSGYSPEVHTVAWILRHGIDENPRILKGGGVLLARSYGKYMPIEQ